MTEPRTVLTGIKPTGSPHVGNFVGAIRPAVELARTYPRSLVFVADLHALNAIDNSEEVARYSREVALALLAAGLDTERTILFRQSDVPEVSQLTVLLSNVTPKGLMNRGHAYKASRDLNRSKNRDPDIGVNMGLFTYPMLMAADILLYSADEVPVGVDQKQHVEFARDIAGYFNGKYGEILRVPQTVLFAEGEMIPGQDGRKMSKSYSNTAPLFGTESDISTFCKRLITDSRPPDEPKEPESVVIFQVYKHFASAAEVAEMAEAFKAGKMSYGTAKSALAKVLWRAVAPFREKWEAYDRDDSDLESILQAGAAKARLIAKTKYEEVSRAMLGR